jgi:hypothetical protein
MVLNSRHIWWEIKFNRKPYPSAIDGDAFILANSGDSSASLSGTLYFGRMDLRYKLEAILMLQKQVQGRMLILLMIILRIR